NGITLADRFGFIGFETLKTRGYSASWRLVEFRNVSASLFGRRTLRLSYIVGGGGLVLCDPGDKKPQPAFSGFGDLHPHPRGSVNRRGNTDNHGGHFNSGAVRPVRAYVQTIAATDFLVEMKERARIRDIVGFGRLAPG